MYASAISHLKIKDLQTAYMIIAIDQISAMPSDFGNKCAIAITPGSCRRHSKRLPWVIKVTLHNYKDSSFID